MSVDFQSFLTSAESLVTGSSEIELRNSISRAYYAAFHRAKKSAVNCPDNNHFVLDAGSHERLIDRYLSIPKGPLQTPGKQIAYSIRQLKTSRVSADYLLDELIEPSAAATHMEMVKRVIKRLDDFDFQATSEQQLPIPQA